MADARRRDRGQDEGMARSTSVGDTPGKSDGPSDNGRGPGTQAPPAGAIRLLLVDRDVRVRAALHQTIALESDLVIVAAADGTAQALAMAESTAPSVALVDLLLPDTGSGLALVRSLSRDRRCAVVAMSDRGGMREAALAAGAFALVDKSGDIDIILDTVRAAHA